MTDWLYGSTLPSKIGNPTIIIQLENMMHTLGITYYEIQRNINDAHQRRQHASSEEELERIDAELRELEYELEMFELEEQLGINQVY